MKQAAQNGSLWRAFTALLFLALLVPAAHAKTVAQKKQIARTQFENAERMREALNGRPASDRTRKDYNQVIDAYRRVYYVAPSSSKADAAVMAVAELLADEARTFNDLKLLQAAIGQYNFLRKEYPGSKYRMDALFTVGQIQRDDLGDDEAAKATFQEFLDKYPHHSLADEAKKAIAQIDADAVAKKKDKNAKAANPFVSKDKNGKDKPKEISDAPDKDVAPTPVQLKTGPFPLVTGIRHWSTPDYTRIAIDLGSEIKYEAGRVPNPDRIFFDLHGTKLAPELVGKTFDVDDGFLRKIRVAQYQRGETRVVLEVNDVADYSAFLLPNPYRLIIDIHGKPPTKVAEVKPAPKPVEPPKKDTVKTDTPKTDTKVETKPAPKVEPKNDTAVATVKPPEPPPAPKPAKKNDDSDRVTTTPSAKDNSDKDTLITAADKPKKDTPSPTTGPTFESVAPRTTKDAKKKTNDTDDNTTATLGQEAKPTSDGDRSLIRALGLKIGKIVVDAGHGGHDTGTIGPKGLEEKDLVLDVALRLGKLLEQRLGADVVYTRDDDTFIPLETRTAIANKEQADLFISVHANSSRDQSARGVEVYYLNFTSAPDALEVAARENAVSDKSIHELQDLVKKIALKEKIEESREFAGDVDNELYKGLRNSGLKNRGVKKAPFIVLIGANMPSILAEISFVSNPNDEKKLKTPEYRQKIAESLYRGVARYANGLSGVKVATKSPNGTGQ